MLEKCIVSLRAQDYPDYEVLMVNGRDYGDCSEVAGQVIGIRQAAGDVILMTNGDMELPPDWISRHMRHYPQADAVLGHPPHLQAYTLFSLSFANFSASRAVMKSWSIVESTHQDLELAFRLYRLGKNVKYVIDNTITVKTDEEDIEGQKAFLYLLNIIWLYKKHKIIPW